MPQPQNLKQHLDLLMKEQKQVVEVINDPQLPPAPPASVAFTNFGHFLFNPVSTIRVNQFGIITTNITNNYCEREWKDDEIPHYDGKNSEGEEKYKPDDGLPPPENSECTTWEEYDKLRCALAWGYAKGVIGAVQECIKMFFLGYEAVGDIICKLAAAVAGFAVGGAIIIGSGGTGSAVAIPAGLTVATVIGLAGVLNNLLLSVVEQVLLNKLESLIDPLVCAILLGSSPEDIKARWDAAIEDMGDLDWLPMKILLWNLMPNRHASLIAEGVGQRALGDCGACTANCLTIASVYTSSFTIIQGDLYNRSVILPDGLVFTAKPGYPAIFTKPAAAAWTWRIGRDCYLGGGECSNMVLYAKDSAGGEFWCGLMYRRFYYKPPGGSWGSQQPNWTAAPCSIIEIEPATTSGDWPHWGVFGFPPNTVEFQIFYENGNENPSSPNRFGARICKG